MSVGYDEDSLRKKIEDMQTGEREGNALLKSENEIVQPQEFFIQPDSISVEEKKSTHDTAAPTPLVRNATAYRGIPQK